MNYTSPKIIDKLSPLLQSKRPSKVKLRVLRLDLAVSLVDWQQLLAEKKRQMLWPKDKELTELDRKIRLDADTAQIERDYKLLQLIWEIVEDLIRLQ